MRLGFDFCAEVVNGVFEEETEEGSGQAFTLEHAIDYLKGFIVHVSYGHVQGDGARAPERENDVGEGRKIFANTVDDKRARCIAECILDICGCKYH